MDVYIKPLHEQDVEPDVESVASYSINVLSKHLSLNINLSEPHPPSLSKVQPSYAHRQH